MLQRRAWLAAGVAAVLLAAGLGAQNQLLQAGETAPDFTLKNVDGNPVNLTELTQKHTVLVNFFFNG